MVTYPLPILHFEGSSVDGASPILPPPCSEAGDLATHGRPPDAPTKPTCSEQGAQAIPE